MVSLAWLAHRSKLVERVKVAMGVAVLFKEGDNVDILLVVFRLLRLQCRWTFTKRFTVSTPQKNAPWKHVLHSQIFCFEIFFKLACVRVYHNGVLSIIRYSFCSIGVNVVIIVNSTQTSLKWIWINIISNYLCRSLISQCLC